MIVLVTGCRSGFGLLIAETLGQAGHTVYAGLRDLESAGELRARTEGMEVIPVQLDVTVEAERDGVVARILEERGRIDALINNAGIALGGFQELIAEEELRKQFEVNVFGLWALTNAVLPAMRSQGSGLICQVTSMAGRIAMPGLGAYAASKHAVEGMTESLRHELRPHGVRVVLVEPGPYKTDISSRNRWEAAAHQTDAAAPYRAQIDALMALVAKAEDRAGDAQEVADLCLRLLTDASPALRHPIGPTAKARALLKSHAPFWVVEQLLKRIVGF